MLRPYDRNRRSRKSFGRHLISNKAYEERLVASLAYASSLSSLRIELANETFLFQFLNQRVVDQRFEIT